MKELLVETLAHFYRELKYVSRTPSWIVVFALLPYVMAAISYLMGLAASSLAGELAFALFEETTGARDPLVYFLVGYGVMMPSFLVISVASQCIGAELYRGTLEHLFSSPINRVLYAVVDPLPWVGVALAALCASYAPILVYWKGLSFALDFLQALLVALVGLLPLVGIGLMSAVLTIKTREYWVASNFLQGVVTLFSGFAYPLSVLPSWMRVVSLFLPTSHAVELIREILEEGASLLPNWRLPVLLLMAPAYVSAGALAFKLVVERGERSGELYR